MRAWDLVTLSGVLCLVVGAGLLVFGDLVMAWLALLPAGALVLIGVGESAQRWSRRPGDRRMG